MKIDFFDLLEDEDWEPIAVDPADPSQSWSGGGTLANAPVDVAATLEGGLFRSLRVDEDFNMRGKRFAPNFTVPWHSNNLRELILVLGGEVTVQWGENGDTATLKNGDFWISEVDAKHTMTAGPEGVVYIETWPVWVELKTTWYPGDGWTSR